jgi:hypothetical protein
VGRRRGGGEEAARRRRGGGGDYWGEGEGGTDTGDISSLDLVLGCMLSCTRETGDLPLPPPLRSRSGEKVKTKTKAFTTRARTRARTHTGTQARARTHLDASYGLVATLSRTQVLQSKLVIS